MEKLNRRQLLSLEDYAGQRDDFKDRVLAHKRHRRVPIGPNLTLYFEDRLTIQYQVQEMLRIERIFEAEGIEDELDAYNPLIPDGDNFKATAMFEFEDVEERRRRLAELVGAEDLIFARVGDSKPVYAIANEDLDRSNQEKTSAVHFLRFQLDSEAMTALASGADLGFGCGHPAYSHETGALDEATRESLLADLDG